MFTRESKQLGRKKNMFTRESKQLGRKKETRLSISGGRRCRVDLEGEDQELYKVTVAGAYHRTDHYNKSLRP
jgi:hypothetical protein